MCGGGGGGDGGAAEREAERERKNQASIASINSIFGIDDPAIYGKPGTLEEIKAREIEGNRRAEEGNSKLRLFYKAGGLNLGSQRRNRALLDKASINKQAREELYGTSRQDIINYFQNQLQEQQTREERLARELFAQRGWTGGGHEISYGQDFEKAGQNALFDIGTRADAAVSDITASDERARQNLISQILSGMDEQSAITGATSALRQNVDTAKSSALQQSLGDVFGDVANLYNLRTVADTRNQQRNQFQNAVRALGLDPKSYAGTIT